MRVSGFLDSVFACCVVVGVSVDGLLKLCFSFFHTLTEHLGSFTEAAHEFGYLFAAEKQKHNKHDNDDFGGAETENERDKIERCHGRDRKSTRLNSSH